MKFFITKHCQKRYIERVNNGLNTDSNLLLTIFKKLYEGKDITDKIYTEAPRYILYLYERFGEACQRIIFIDNIFFIVRKRKGTYDLYDVLTCYFDNNKLSQFKNCITPKEEIYLKIKQIKKKIRNNERRGSK